MAFSIAAVIPVYNGAADIRRSVESVLAQTRAVDELIVVDDGSTDDTAGIVRQYGEKVRLLRQPNRGVAAARNHGVREARSEWIALLDHDDEWLPRKIEIQAAELERHPEAKLSYSGYWLHTVDGRTVRRHIPARDLWPEARLRNPFPPSCVMLRKAELAALGGFDERLRGATCEDWELFVRFLAAHPALDIPEPLMRYHETTGGNSRRHRLMLDNMLSIVESLLSGLSGWERAKWRRRIKSGMYFRTALAAADAGEASLEYLARSLAQWPFPDEYARYKRLAMAAGETVRGLTPGKRPHNVT